MTDATELDDAAVREAVEGADARQWAEEWWRCHADDYFRAAMAGCPELVAYFGTITPTNMRLLLDEITRLRAALASIRTLARSWSGRHDLLMTGDSAAHDIEAALAANTTTERSESDG